VAGGALVATASYAAYVAVAWSRYGRYVDPGGDAADPLLDRFMPEYEVVERHHVRVFAPAEITQAAAADLDLHRSAVIRAVFKGRELVMGADPDEAVRPRAFLPLVKSLGWGVLAEVPDREIVMGAVTQPWKANVVFRALPPEEFAAFHEPGYVKIVWTLRADPAGPGESVARTETRAATTDPAARAKFRRYWSLASPGIRLIRHFSLAIVKEEAERRAARRSLGREARRSDSHERPTPR
jgi:hypothetical protein